MVRKILITDSSTVITTLFQSLFKDQPYQILVAHDGETCLEIVKKEKPDLLFLDLILPKVHGMQILKQLKSNEETANIGIIISTGKALIQDYQESIISGANYYLTKPFEKKKVCEIVYAYFEGTLTPTPFAATQFTDLLVEKYEPTLTEPSNYIKLWGTRGSIPVAGLEYHRHGGNTSCLEVRSGKALIIIDAGSGIRELGDLIMKSDIEEIHLFIGHTHWDHIMGFPFFLPLYDRKYKIKIYAAKGFRKDIRELFTGMLDHDYFPVRLEDMRAVLQFQHLQDGQPIKIEDVVIHYTFCTHPGATLCFKIATRSTSVGYVTDNEFLLGYHGHPARIHKTHSLLMSYKGLIHFLSDCPILIHEAQYTPQEYQLRVGWGHSSISNAAVLVKYTNTKSWIVVHHDPSHTDEKLFQKMHVHRKVMEECNIDARCIMAHDGMIIPI